MGVINLDRGKSWYPHSWRARCLDRGQDRTLGGVGMERPDVSGVSLEPLMFWIALVVALPNEPKPRRVWHP